MPSSHKKKSQKDELLSQVLEAIKTIYDPEIPVNIFDLGLVYDIKVGKGGKVEVVMTLTTPACPMAEEIPEQVRTAVLGVAGVSEVKVELVWDPPWDPSKMTEDARLALGIV